MMIFVVSWFEGAELGDGSSMVLVEDKEGGWLKGSSWVSLKGSKGVGLEDSLILVQK